ncbi:peptidylprolyl isomerase [Paenibacillus mucilaginosus]|uniref:Peptidyl-prolyl cis-trans isomerase D n=2 Tax=Paenibacillus mucilaginosus TaxID=61624 RepID=H6NSG5_9BACL|nr:peptidylprolyl isomerase [Paenibacillus mucilaginosus]AEI46087.1 peptidyl-prolyl cis-trans isomerase D, putative [Paenibacillus mucilaginosus KNP414]AFC33715.1 peptidyl-prolyl cis-trans isomerase D [Paenibacillus mucilaginosus 3016]MCG7217950.1 peptidylprolyl isomerase [Paenibacillus mucilaginosus]WDM27428.1 peptidylprolyl isomerase [Paenibacillus mucilaginosus]WFA22115.1 peptidylprolyl isomerase [Paenibacillus mucilaginosus]
MLQNKKKPLRQGMMALMALVLVAGLSVGCGKKKDEEAAPAPAPAGTEAPAASTGNPSDVLVTYKDGGKVTREEFDKFVGINLFFNKQYEQFKSDPAFQQDMMKQLVTFKVLASRADEKAKTDAAAQTKTQMEQIKAFLGAQEGGLEGQLKTANVTEKELEDFVTRSITAIVSEENKVSEADLKTAYDGNLKTDAAAYTTATVSHILVGLKDTATQKDRTDEEALKRAQEVKGKLDAGGDFAALAKEYSDDPGSKDAGGKYENAEVSQWVPEFKQAAVDLPLNKISDPVKTDYGYHVMKVESRATKTFEDVKPQLKSQAAEAKVYEFVEKELPTLIETNNLPKPEEQPATQAPATEAPKTDAPATEAPKTEGTK